VDNTTTISVETTAATAELMRNGHGSRPPLAPKKSVNDSNVSGARKLGGFVAASTSECRPVRIIQRIGVTKISPTSQATTPSATFVALPRFRRRGAALDVAGVGAAAGAVRVAISSP